MDEQPNNVTDPSLNASEHMEENVIAKRTALYGWYPASLAWNRVQTDQNGVLQSNVVVNASIAVTGGVTTVFQGGAPWLINGNVTVYGTFNANVNVSQVFQGGAPWTVLSSVQGQIPVTGTFYQSNQPVLASIAGTVPVSASLVGIPGVNATYSAPWAVVASVIGNIPVTATLATISVGNTLGANVSIQGAPGVIASIANFPTNQVVSGSVTVYGNLSSTGVSTVYQAGAPWLVNASIIGNIPVTATLATISVGNFPTTQTVAGSVTVYGNFSGGSSVTTVYQAGAPWLVNASIIGQIPVTMTTATLSVGLNNVLATVVQGGAFNVTATVGNTITVTGFPATQNVIATIANASIPVTESGAWNVTATIGNIPAVSQSGAPWLVSASVGTPTVNQGTTPWNSYISTVVTLAIGAMPNIAVSVSQVFQGGAPWLVTGSVGATQLGAPWTVNASVQGIPGVIATVLQGTNPWLVNASVIGFGTIQQFVTATYASPWAVVASQYANLPQIMASTSNSAILTGAVEMSAYSPTTVTIVSSATYAYYPNFTDINTQDLVTPGASSSSVGTQIAYIASLVATLVTVKSSGGSANLYGYHIYNNNSSAIYIGLYGQTLATAGLTARTAQLVVPAGGWVDASPSGPPIGFNSGLLVGASVSINGTGNPTNSILANFWYK